MGTWNAIGGLPVLLPFRSTMAGGQFVVGGGADERAEVWVLDDVKGEPKSRQDNSKKTEARLPLICEPR